MAKVKKGKLTIEDALVPVEEQEYEIPNNWVWIYQNIACQLGDGEKKDNEELPYLEVKYLRGNMEAKTKKSGKYIPANTKVILVDGENSGEVFEVPENGYMGSTFKVLNISKGIDERYLLYYVESKKDLLRNNKTGSAIPHLNKKLFFSMGFPLPPQVEQRRIVEQIENLFSKLDEAKEKTQLVVEQYKDRRATIIHKAYTGEITRLWRSVNNIEFSTWNMFKIKDVCKSLKYGTSNKSLEEGKVIVIRMGNLQEGEIVWDNLAYTNDNDDIEKYILEEGDVLFNRTNSPEWVGKTSIYRGEQKAIYAGYLIKLDYNRDILDGEFLNYMLNSAKAKEYCNSVKTDGVNQSNINAQKIGAFSIPVPSLDEQKEIVRILKDFLEKEKQVKLMAESVAEQIDLMKKSILAKAFRGELGTNIESEESSIEELKKILSKE